MTIPALSRRASVRLPSSRFQPLLPEPGVPISGTGLSSGIMRLAHGPPGDSGMQLVGIPDVIRGSCTASALHMVSHPASRRACSRLDDIEPVRFDSFTYACDASGIVCPQHGVPGIATPAEPSSFRHRSTPEVPFLDRHYPASSVVRTSPPPRPARPAPRGGPVGACHATDGASRVAASIPPPCVLPPIPRRNRPVPS